MILLPQRMMWNPVETAKTNLSKRRTIDNMLEERRLQKQLADFDYDL